MRLFLSFFITLNLISFSNVNAQNTVASEEQKTVIIEITDAVSIPFAFSMEYSEKRQIIKIKSEEPIKSLRTVEQASNSHKGYNVMGSDMIILPQRDFKPGNYIAEIKFMESDFVVLANMYVLENPVAGQDN